jgi:hypothetical protein
MTKYETEMISLARNIRKTIDSFANTLIRFFFKHDIVFFGKVIPEV